MTTTAATPTTADIRRMGPLRSPGAYGGLRDVFKHRYLLWLLVRKEIKVRYQGSALGLLWSYIQPLVRFLVYYFVANLIIAHKTPNRALHIFSGMIIMQFFQTCLSAGCKAVIKNKSLVKKVNLPREMFPVASVAVSLYNMLPMYLILVIGDFICKWTPDIGALWAGLLGFGIVLLWGLGFAIFLSAVNVFVRDTQNIVEVVNQVLRWTAPVIYTYSAIQPHLANHEWINQIYINNPFNAAVMMNNRAFWITSFPNSTTPESIQQGVTTELPPHLFERGLIVFAAGFIFVGICAMVFARLEGRFAEKIA